MSNREESFVTRSVHGAVTADPVNHPAALPIYQSAGWTFRDLEEVDAVYEHRLPGAVYGTDGVPNVLALENLLAQLEGAEAALATGGGMSALAAVFLALLRSGDRVVAGRDLYGNTTRLLGDFEKFGVAVSFVDVTDLAAVNLELNGRVRLVLAETISNPRMRVADIGELASAAHESGALLLIDNTFATPYHCRPLEHGADLVMESATKFLGGHHDVVCGIVAGNSDLLAQIRTTAVRASLAPSAFDAWLAARSVPTLVPRLMLASENAMRLAMWLEQQPQVRAVHYPGLPNHPDHPAARAVLSNGYGAMLSFEIAGGRPAVDRLLHALSLIRLVLSFGGVATTLSHPASSSHRALRPEQRAALGIHDGFLRLSVGTEDFEDIKADMARGLEACA